MPTYRVLFIEETEIEAENEEEAFVKVRDDIIDYYSLDKEYYKIEEVIE